MHTQSSKRVSKNSVSLIILYPWDGDLQDFFAGGTDYTVLQIFPIMWKFLFEFYPDFI